MRPKAYLAFESDSDDDFRFFLAYTLKKTIDEIDALSYMEYMKWAVWLGRKSQYEELAAKSKGR